jgi:elongation factor G
MKNVSINRYRNIGIMAHIDAGKTTVSERILFYAGLIHTMGEVHDGDTVMDDDPRERARGITINSAATTLYWKGSDGSLPEHRINLIDTPGHIDFTVEVERSLRVLDGAVCVLDGSQGVEPQTEQVWRQADRYNVARICFVNKMDKAGASFHMTVDSIREKLGVKAVPIQLPYGEEEQFHGVIDLINMKIIRFDDSSKGKKLDELTLDYIPDSLLSHIHRAREHMLEALADVSDSIMEKFLEGRLSDISVEEIHAALRKGTVSRTLYPVLCGSALKNKGVQMLLDAIVAYLPSPDDLVSVTGTDPHKGTQVTRKLVDEEPLSALAFKIISEDTGNLTFIRVYSGVLKAGSYVYNVSRGQKERISRLVLMHATNDREKIEEAGAGTIVAAIGLKSTYTGDSLCEEKHQLLLEKMDFPDPVVELSIEPKTSADLDKLAIALQKMLLEDPSLKAYTDPDTSQTILKGMGELHLEIVVDKLRTDRGVGVTTGKPRVSYRETITRTSGADYKHKSQNGGKGTYGHAVISVKPGARGSGFVFKDEVVGGKIPREFIPSVEKGIKNTLQSGIYSGNPMVDIEVTLLDGSTHSVDGCAFGFELAGSKAIQEAVMSAGPTVLEPIMAVEVVAPEQYMGEVIGCLSARAGQVTNTLSRGNARVIQANVPLRNLFGVTTDLRGRTQGRATPSMVFSHYDYCALKPSELDK